MKYKKMFYLVLILCTLLSLTACQRKSTDTVSQNGKETKQEKDFENTEEEREGKKGDLIKEEQLDLKKYTLEYQAQTDFQGFFQSSSVAKSENGYYMWGVGKYNDMLLFMDATSGKTVPLCNLPNCKHEQEEKKENCNAYFSSAIGSENTYEVSYIQFYENNLYILGWNKDGYVCLFKVAPDGSTREEYMTLYRADTSDLDNANDSNSSEWLVPDVCIHRGYIYFINQRESKPKIRRLKLGRDREAEVVYETEGIRPNLYRMQGYGEFIFFQSGHYTDDSCEHVEGGIYTYNIQSGETTLVKKDAISTYILKEDIIYYSSQKEVRKYSLSNQTDEAFCRTEEAYPIISLDFNYIYVVNDMVITIYNFEGQEVNKVSQIESIDYYFGDDLYLFTPCIGSDTNGGNIKRLKKADIKKGKETWEDLYVSS